MGLPVTVPGSGVLQGSPPAPLEDAAVVAVGIVNGSMVGKGIGVSVGNAVGRGVSVGGTGVFVGIAACV